ncbi:MAG TPA: hypothetical protein VJS66_02125, partial [Burkholderiales bacterium]|nr:hypothetical protein [Burkholderiales bacterium]
MAWSNYEGADFPKTGIALCITLFWVWLAISAVWGRVGYLGAIYFWLLGSFPLVFWIYVLSPRQEELWRLGFRWVTVVGVALAVGATCQRLIYGMEPIATFLNRNSLAALFNLNALPLCG